MTRSNNNNNIVVVIDPSKLNLAQAFVEATKRYALFGETMEEKTRTVNYLMKQGRITWVESRFLEACVASRRQTPRCEPTSRSLGSREACLLRAEESRTSSASRCWAQRPPWAISCCRHFAPWSKRREKIDAPTQKFVAGDAPPPINKKAGSRDQCIPAWALLASSLGEAMI